VVARKAITEADGDDDNPGMAICRIFNLEDEKAKQHTIDKKAQRKKLLEKKTKELELNWAIDPHDLTYKLKALRRFLERGLRVDVLLSKKKRGRTASVEEATNVLLQVRELAAQMNVKEKRQEGRIGGTMTFTLEPEGSEIL
jgi:translation initiation factor IF-3